MVWEVTAIIIGVIALIHGLYLDKRYATMINHLNVRVIEMENEISQNYTNDNNDRKDFENQISEHIRALFTAKTQRSGNRRMAVIDTICFIGILFLGLLLIQTFEEGVVLLLLCLPPVYMLVYRLNDVSERFVKRR